jgi:GDPmannose 4,6-dehydratase
MEVVKEVSPLAKVYQASSSEMFGNCIDQDGFQREDTPMNPVSPYGCSKLFGYNITRNYRNSYNLFVSNGILFNHESPRRGTNFVTNKVVKEAVKIKLGLSNELVLGNLDASRDWGHAKDYVKAMWLILQLDKPGDYVCATGISHTVRELVEYVFSRLDMNWENYIKQDQKFFRPEELNDLKGDPTKLKKDTDWKPEYTFESMLDEMIEYWQKEFK